MSDKTEPQPESSKTVRPDAATPTDEESEGHSLELSGEEEGRSLTDEEPGKDPLSGTSDDDDDSHGATKGDEGKMPSKKKIRRGFTNLHLPTFIENVKSRGKMAKQNGASLERAAKNLAIRTGAKVYLKAEYNTKTVPYVFKYGKDFKFTREEDRDASSVASPTPPVVDATVVKEAVEEGFKGALEKLTPQAPAMQFATATQSDDVFASPSVPVSSRVSRRSTSTSGCLVCGVDEPFIEVRGQRLPAEFFFCGKVGCKGKIHNDCLGLPAGKFSAIAKIAQWYCTLHVGMGRLPLPDADETEVAPPAPSAAASRGKNASGDAASRRGRGRPRKS